MEGFTVFNVYDKKETDGFKEIKRVKHPITLKVGEEITIETSPKGDSAVHEIYRVEEKSTYITISGQLVYEYTLNLLTTQTGKKDFILY